MNYVSDGGRNELSLANTQYNVNLNSKGKNIALSFWNGNGVNAHLSIWYVIDEGTNILLIILGVLGGVLFILLLVVAIYIVKKMNSNEMRQIQPNSPLRSRNRQQNNDNVLTGQ